MGRVTPRRYPDPTQATWRESPRELDVAVAALREGAMVVVGDPPDGDGVLVMAASHATSAGVAFMSREARGVVSLNICARRAQELGLRADSGSTESSATISIDAARGAAAGPSAADRATVIRAAAEPTATAADFIRPGHVFVNETAGNGVLARPGRGEAAVDLARLAGCGAVAVTCALLDKDGMLVRGAALREFCLRHRLAQVSVGDVVDHRRRFGPEVERVVVASIPTRFGTFDAVGYRSLEHDLAYVALVKGDVAGAADVALHVQLECLPGQVFQSRNCGCERRLERAMESIVRRGAGVIIHLPRPNRGLYTDAQAANDDVGAATGVGAQILRDLRPVSVVSTDGADREPAEVDPVGRVVVETAIRRQLLDCDGLGHLTSACEPAGRLDPRAKATIHA